MSDANSNLRWVGARPKRHLIFGGYASGRRTRAHIISAALRVFGEYGYDGASTRRIAECAGVRTPAIQYYFDGKQGLYAACARQVMGQFSSRLEMPLLRARDAVRTAEPALALEALCELLAALVDGLMTTQVGNWTRYLACLTWDGGTPAQVPFLAHGGTGMFDTLTRLIAAATGESADGKPTRLRACMLLGQVCSLYENRALTLAVMGWSHFDEHALDLIKSIVREHTRSALAAPLESEPRTNPRHQGRSWARP